MIPNTEELVKNLRDIIAGHRTIDGIPTDELIMAADRLEELQRLNDSMQVDRHLWIKVGREKLHAAEKERDEALANVEVLKLNRDDWQAQANLDAVRREQLRQELHDARLENSGQAALLDESRAEVERVKKALHNALAEISRLEKITPVVSRTTVRPEPSRLEIAAMILAAMCGSTYIWAEAESVALKKADALIAAAAKGG
jgi:chromosome segregation ATPase